MIIYSNENHYLSLYKVNSFSELIIKLDEIVQKYKLRTLKMSFSVDPSEMLLEGKSEKEWNDFITFYINTWSILMERENALEMCQRELKQDTKWLKNYITEKAIREMRLIDNKKKMKNYNMIIKQLKKDIEQLKKGN